MSLEGILLILLLAYVLSFLLIGLIKGREYLRSYPTGEQQYLFHSIEITLTLAGLSVTALALFISVRYENLLEISSILLFFSLSFSMGILSSVFARFQTRNLFPYLADMFADTALLAIGCGFLAFFEPKFQWSEGLTITYIAFITIFILLSLLNFYKYYRYWSVIGGGKKRAQKPTTNSTRIRRSTLSFYAGIMVGLLGSLFASSLLKISETILVDVARWIVLVVWAVLFIFSSIGFFQFMKYYMREFGTPEHVLPAFDFATVVCVGLGIFVILYALIL